MAKFITVTIQCVAVVFAASLLSLTHSKCIEIVSCIVFLLSSLLPSRSKRLSVMPIVLAWFSALLLILSLVSRIGILLLDNYFSLVFWLLALSTLLSSKAATQPTNSKIWKILTVLLAGIGILLWLGKAYFQNDTLLFYSGLAIALVFILCAKFWLQLPRMWILTANTAVLLVVFLPLIDLLIWQPTRPDPHPNVAGEDYLYRKARMNPHAFKVWRYKFLAQYDRLAKELFAPDPHRILPFRLKTNAVGDFFECKIPINHLGFRGQEIESDKGDTFRIVALGESTTFGFTLTQQHKPWPEILQQMLENQMKLGRRVEVINAGVPIYTLRDNVSRLRTDVLPLKPDMIISYHGWNGFEWLFPALPPIADHPPVYKQRPLRLFTEAEYNLKMMFYRRRRTAKPMKQLPSLDRIMETQYAAAYRDLIEMTGTNGIQLVVANYSMAVNTSSNPDVIDFYREIFPPVYAMIQANVMHSMLVKQLVTEHPEILFVDTHPGLDGEHDKFIDLMHFAPEGDRQFAETMFSAIRPLLQRKLARSSN